MANLYGGAIDGQGVITPAWVKQRNQQEPWHTLGNTIINVGQPPSLDDVERLQRLFGSWSSIYNISYRLAPYNPDTLTTQKGYDTMSYGANGQPGMLQMAACRAPYNLKRMAILSKGFKVELHPSATDMLSSDHSQGEELQTFVYNLLDNITEPETGFTQPFAKVLYDLLSAMWMGFSVSELEWRVGDSGKYRGKYLLAGVNNKPCKQIGFNLDERNLTIRSFFPYTPLHGYGPAVPLEKALIYSFDMDQNLPYGNGLSRSCYKHWWILDSILKFWCAALERFGGGALVAQYPAGNTSAAAEAITALDNMRNNISGVLPDNVKYDFIQASAGMFEGFKQAAEWNKQEIAQQVLGNTLSMGEGQHGTQALGSVHENTRMTGDNFVAMELENVINTQLIRRAIAYNYGERALDIAPRVTIVRQKEIDLFNLANAFNILITSGNMDALNKSIREEMGLPPMDENEDKILREKQEREQQIKEMIAQAEVSRKSPDPGSQAAQNQKAGAKKAMIAQKFAAFAEDFLEVLQIAA